MKECQETEQRILIVGCGGIGGVLGASLHQGGTPISIATTNESVRRAWTTSGPRIGSKWAGAPVPTDAIRPSATDFDEPFDTAFVAVQPPQVEQVVTQLAACLSSRGRVVCLSNGLCEEKMAETLEPERIVGAVVSWGARMKTPGHYTRTSKGGFLLGKLTDEVDPRLDDIARVLENIGPVQRTNNLRGARFSKLTVNCAVTALGTIGGAKLGQLLVRKGPRHLALALMRESAQVAQAEGVVLEPITKVDLARLATARGDKKIDAIAKHAVLLIAGARYRKLRSSMLAAMERGRQPAIDFINGEIVSRGERHGLATPYNRAATQVVWEIYRGERQAGKDALSRVEYLAKK